MSEKQHTPEESNHYLNALDILNDGDGDYKIKTIADLLAKVEALQKFKDYTHKRLDDMGIPVDPESPHKAAGCRIGGRMDEVEKVLAKVEETKQIGELLAIMHGDGGHHQQAVGTKQAILDAIELLHKKWVTNESLRDINNLCAKVEEQGKEIDDLRGKLRQIVSNLVSETEIDLWKKLRAKGTIAPWKEQALAMIENIT